MKFMNIVARYGINPIAASINVGPMADVISLITAAVTVGGGLWTIWGVVVLAGSLKDKNGPGLQGGIWQIVGGGLILAGGMLFNSLLV